MNSEETYCVIRDFQSTDEMSIVNHAIQDEEVLFTGTQGECETFVQHPIQDDIWPSRRWNKDYTSSIDLSGVKDDIASYLEEYHD